MKRTAASGPVVHFSTRNMPAPLLQRVKARASALRLTIEDTMNLAVELGIATLERQAARATEREALYREVINRPLREVPAADNRANDNVDLEALYQAQQRNLSERQDAMTRSLYPEETKP